MVADTRTVAAPFRYRRLWAAARAVAMVAIIIGSAIAVYAEHTTISSGAASLRHSNVGWIVAGFGAECLSMAAFALLQQRLIAAAGARARRAGQRTEESAGITTHRPAFDLA